MLKSTVHMIGNAHIDPVWLWLWPEGLEAARATFRSAIDRMKETPEFIFTAAQAAVYRWIEKTDPVLFREIQEAVAAHRWVIVGGWWMQPDCNIPSGESFIRQALYAQKYFREKFGVRARVAYNVDSFGHNGMLPQILTKCGFELYVFMRPDKNENRKAPNLFWWESPDGSRILTYKIPDQYGLWNENVKERIVKAEKEARNSTGNYMAFYGVGNHGGGPTKAQIAAIKELKSCGLTVDDTDIAVEFSSPDGFADAVKAELANGAELPVYSDDLQHHASGCYSVQSEIKKNNRASENLLGMAEIFGSMASRLTEFCYPSHELEKAWEGVLFNQFHDILAGTSFPEAYDHARDLHGMALTTARDTVNFAVQSIAARIDTGWTDGYETALVLFNPHSWEVAAPAELTYQFGIPWKSISAEDGTDIPMQIAGNGQTVSNRSVCTFVAKVPPMGYRVLRCLKKEPSAGPQSKDAIEVSGFTIENDTLIIKIQEGTGYIESIIDKASGVGLLKSPGAVPKVMVDKSDTWSHGVLRFNKQAGTFGNAKISLVESGPVRARIRAESTFGNSRFIQEFIVYKELPWIEVRVEVDWHETYKTLKLCFPVDVQEPKVTYEIPYGHMQRPADGEEEPMQRWVDVTGGMASEEVGLLGGISVVNDGKYGCSVNGGEIQMTVLRSPAYAHHDPSQPGEGEVYRYIDQGVQRFRYLIYPHMGELEPCSASKAASELNQPPVALVESNHGGTLPRLYTGISISDGSVAAVALKRAEKGDGYILRLQHFGDSWVAADIALHITGHTWNASFGPQELKTYRIPDDADCDPVPCNLLEE